jgi:hypothetical protein
VRAEAAESSDPVSAHDVPPELAAGPKQGRGQADKVLGEPWPLERLPGRGGLG